MNLLEHIKIEGQFLRVLRIEAEFSKTRDDNAIGGNVSVGWIQGITDLPK